MKRKVGCILGIHHPQNKDGTIKLFRVGKDYYDIVEECKYCGEYVREGSIEMPPPTYMNNWSFKIIND